MKFICKVCYREYSTGTYEFRCACGGLFDLVKEPGETIKSSISLGETVTPVLLRDFDGLKLHLKLDYLMPTGSFKDRGAYALINHAYNIGVKDVVEDSSGNAAASIAAYSAAAGIKCNIYIPASTSEGKVKQMKAYGANVVKIEGSRDDVARATLDAAENTYYASHVYNPIFYEGTGSIVEEIETQTGTPDWLVIPVGNGTMLIGAYKAYKALGKMPRILAVQSENCATVYNAFHGKDTTPVSPTVAEGIAVGLPMRKEELVQIIQESGGTVITVADEEVKEANKRLSLMGIYCEPTSAASVAGALKYFKKGEVALIVAPLTGSGLKKG